ncbi:hypothetical protein CIC12_12025 [Burkholderia sp. SG-MS1]|uniref:hypothetical protein n=1 Tax=Paraburkholderia sp. SG-MS1 TaxID=2023741 RepID=UPI0014484F07|nr:hypothetical protein [Paraburkholderia sp. SG-MS1]NKJ47456.1 hypothetical protein [Paraburkholderia sp. SG-MS1]
MSQTVNAAFASAPDDVYQAGGTPLARTIAHVATDGEWAINERAWVFARVSVDLGNHEQNDSRLAGLNWKW